MAGEDPEKERALAVFRRALLEHHEADARCRTLRQAMVEDRKKYEKSEDDLKALQSIGQMIGEVLRQLDSDRYIVKASSGPRYVVGCRDKVDKDLLKSGTRVTLDMTTLTIMRILPREIDPMVFNMQAEDPGAVKYSGPDSRKNLKREIDILRKVDHPNIIGLKDLYNSKEKLFLIMELVEGGELFDKIVERGSYTEQEAATLVSKIVSAIEYLHRIDIVHRDLKPENLLLRNGHDITEVCIADFGLSKIVGQSTMMQTACGTPSYVAPEVLSATGYGAEVDIWSIGVITYILLCGFPPFYGDTVPDIFEQIMAADYDFPEEYWDVISDDAKDFIEKMLVVDPAKRMTTAEALNHPWIKTKAAKSAADAQSSSAQQLKVGEKIGAHMTQRNMRRQESVQKN